MKRSHLNLALIICISAIVLLGSALFITAYLTYGESCFTKGFDRGPHRMLSERTDTGNNDITTGGFLQHKFHFAAPHNFLGGFGFLVIAGIVIFVIMRRKTYRHSANPSAMDILREKYAAGEITVEEYEKRKKALKEE